MMLSMFPREILQCQTALLTIKVVAVVVDLLCLCRLQLTGGKLSFRALGGLGWSPFNTQILMCINNYLSQKDNG